MRFPALALFLPLALCGTGAAGPLLLDTAELRAETVARRSALTGTLLGEQRRAARALDRALGLLDGSSSTLEGDLRILRGAVTSLERTFRDGTMEDLLLESADRAEDLVRQNRDVLEAFRLWLPLRAVDGRLRAADRAGTQVRRVRCLEQAMRRIRKGMELIPRDGGGGPGGGGGGGGGALPPLSTLSARVSLYGLTPYAWNPDAVTATVTLDGDGNPTALRISGVQTSAGGALATFDLGVALGFTGTGTWNPTVNFDPDGAGGPIAYFTPSGMETGNTVVVTEFDRESRRIRGTFSTTNLGSYYRTSCSLAEGTFDIRGFLVE